MRWLFFILSLPLYATDLREFAVMSRCWEKPACFQCATVDYTGNGVVDLVDLMIFAERWCEVSLPNKIQVMGITDTGSFGTNIPVKDAEGVYVKQSDVLYTKGDFGIYYEFGQWIIYGENHTAGLFGKGESVGVIGDDYFPQSTYTGTAAVVPYIPPAPVVSVAAGTSSLAVSITGEAGAVHTVLYKPAASAAWLAGGTRTGDGTITLSGLAAGTYQVMAYSTLDYENSPPGELAQAVIAAPVTDFAQWRADNYGLSSTLEKAALDLLAAFGEAIIYQPAGGAARSITAVVDYGTVSKLSPMPNGFAPQMTVSVFNNASYGVTAAAINTGGDLFVLPTRIGGTPQSRRISKITHQDEGMVVFEVR